MLIGFVILSHQNPRQLARLVRTLNRLYDNPPIACHHDTSQSSLDPREFPGNVTFVAQPLRTGWAKWSIVAAALAALRDLYANADPDWYVLLSASDYPIASPDRVRAELAESQADALIDHRLVGSDPQTATRLHGPRNPTLDHFEAPANRQMLRGRYLGAELWLPMVRFNGPRGPRLGRRTLHLPFDNPWRPFTAEFQCYCGDQWYAGSRKAAQVLLNPSPLELRLQRYLHTRAVPDECYYQTVLCNRRELSVQRDSRRYAQWNGGGAHPSLLNSGDLDRMLASGAYFARKFAHDDPVLDRVDEVLLGAPASTLPVA
jgi:hypothetical protein